MTNRTYFYSVIRDTYTDSSSSQGDVTPQTSQRHTGVEEEGLSGGESDISTYSISKPFKFKRFTFEELTTATTYSRFSKFEKLFTSKEFRTTMWYSPICLTGDHKSDRVFKGYIHKKTLLPTKSRSGLGVDIVLLAKAEQLEDPRGWVGEVKYLQQLSHPNLVRLLGYCLYNEHQLLVYEGMPRNLEDCLCRGSVHILPWGIRMKVALGAAKGLAFLHRAHVIYRNFRTSHVHLDRVYNAKLSHFGLSKDHLTGGKSHVAPEYPTTGHLTAKSDVYSFGVLLLEMLSGRQAGESDESNLVEWAMPYIECNILHVLDRKLEAQYSLKSVEKVADLIRQCLVWEAELRPNMDEVTQKLELVQDSQYMNITKREEVWMSIYSSLSQDAADADTDTTEDEQESEYIEDDLQDLDYFATREQEQESLILDGR